MINFGNTELPTWEDNSRFHVFYTEKEAQKCYDKLLKRFDKNFSKYIKKLKTKIIKIDDEINHLVDQQEYIESILDKYREYYVKGYFHWYGTKHFKTIILAWLIYGGFCIW